MEVPLAELRMQICRTLFSASDPPDLVIKTKGP